MPIRRKVNTLVLLFKNLKRQFVLSSSKYFIIKYMRIRLLFPKMFPLCNIFRLKNPTLHLVQFLWCYRVWSKNSFSIILVLPMKCVSSFSCSISQCQVKKRVLQGHKSQLQENTILQRKTLLNIRKAKGFIQLHMADDSRNNIQS